MIARPLVITGAGGFARETAEIVHAINDERTTWDLLGFLDDNSQLWGLDRGGLPVLGGTEWLLDHEVATVVCVGSPSNYMSRAAIVDRLALPDARYATLIHPAAAIAVSTTIGRGTVISAGCVTTADVRIEDHVALMPHCVFTHDDIVGEFATCGAGVRAAGGVTVGRGAYIGAGALIREYVTIGEGSLVGMGAVVTKSVPDGEVWAGVPARFVRPAPLPGAHAPAPA